MGLVTKLKADRETKIINWYRHTFLGGRNMPPAIVPRIHGSWVELVVQSALGTKVAKQKRSGEGLVGWPTQG